MGGSLQNHGHCRIGDCASNAGQRTRERPAGMHDGHDVWEKQAFDFRTITKRVDVFVARLKVAIHGDAAVDGEARRLGKRRVRG